jgi:hypothetical protein
MPRLLSLLLLHLPLLLLLLLLPLLLLLLLVLCQLFPRGQLLLLHRLRG